MIQLTGIDSVSKQQVALRFSPGWDSGLSPSRRTPSVNQGELETLARLWHRESTLLPLALYLDDTDSEDGRSRQRAVFMLNRFVARCGTLIFLDTREPRPGLGLNALAFEVGKPTPVEQQAAWKEALGENAAESPDQLAGQFNLNLPAIRRIASAVLADRQQDDALRAYWNTSGWHA